MKLSAYGLSMAGFVLLTIVLKVINIEFYSISTWVLRIGVLCVMIMLVIISLIVFLANKRRGTEEVSTWLLFFIASSLNLIGGVLELLPVIINGISNPETITLVGNIFFLLTYISFIVGLAIANYRFSDYKKANVTIPSIVVTIMLAVGLYFLINQMAQTGESSLIVQISFIVFIVMDAVLVLLAWLLAKRTWGGSFSSSYVTIAVGCIALVLFHIVATYLMVSSTYTLDSVFRLIYIVAIGLIGTGGDIRLSIEDNIAL